MKNYQDYHFTWHNHLTLFIGNKESCGFKNIEAVVFGKKQNC